MGDMLVVRSKIKEVAKGMNVSSSFAEALSGFTASLIKDAEARTQENKRSTVMGKDVAFAFVAPKKAPDSLVVRSKVKEAIKSCNMAGDLAETLDRVLLYVIQRACERAKENKRSTIQPRDL